jgi:hypothetical protein
MRRTRLLHGKAALGKKVSTQALSVRNSGGCLRSLTRALRGRVAGIIELVEGASESQVKNASSTADKSWLRRVAMLAAGSFVRCGRSPRSPARTVRGRDERNDSRSVAEVSAGRLAMMLWWIFFKALSSQP